MTKDREAIHMLKEDMGLADIWRLTNPHKKEFTFFPIATNHILGLTTL